MSRASSSRPPRRRTSARSSSTSPCEVEQVGRLDDRHASRATRSAAVERTSVGRAAGAREPDEHLRPDVVLRRGLLASLAWRARASSARAREPAASGRASRRRRHDGRDLAVGQAALVARPAARARLRRVAGEQLDSARPKCYAAETASSRDRALRRRSSAAPDELARLVERGPRARPGNRSSDGSSAFEQEVVRRRARAARRSGRSLVRPAADPTMAAKPSRPTISASSQRSPAGARARGARRSASSPARRGPPRGRGRARPGTSRARPRDGRRPAGLGGERGRVASTSASHPPSPRADRCGVERDALDPGREPRRLRAPRRGRSAGRADALGVGELAREP